MSILILERPEKAHLYSGNISKFNAVHNVIQYRMRRQDYSIVWGTMVNNFLRITIPQIQLSEHPLHIGDSIYVSTAGKTGEVQNIAYAAGFAYVIVNINYTISMAVSGYANNMSSQRMFHLEVTLFVYNNKTNATETAAVFDCYPDTKGMINVICHEYLKKYLNNKNESPYTGTNYNDINAWCKFYIGYRSVWVGNDNEAVYEDRANPYLGSNMLTNGDFPIDLTGWETDNIIWRHGGKANKQEVVQTAYLRPSNWASFPSVAGKKYRLSFDESEVTFEGAVSVVNGLLVYFADEFHTYGTYQFCPHDGHYELDFTATNDGDFPLFEAALRFYFSIDNIKLQPINDDVDNAPRWMYATKSALQIHSKYNSNLALHNCHFDTLDALIKRAKFICDFNEPTWHAGLPFDIAVLFDESMIVSDVKRKEEIYNFNVATGINEYTLTNKKAGEQRIRLFGGYPVGCPKIKVWLEVGDVVNDEYVDEEYADDGYMTVNEGLPSTPTAEEGEVTERRVVRIGNNCADNPVYIAWKGKQGGWSYYLFTRTQDITSTTSDQSIAEPYIDNLDVQGNRYQIDISSTPSITMGCSGIDRNDVDGILKMLESGCIRIYLGTHEITGLPEWEDVIVKSGSFKITNSNMRHDIEFTLDKPFIYTHSA